MDQYWRTATEARQIAPRIAPANIASLKFAEKAGFTFRGVFDEPEGSMARYVRDIESG
jgi:RimJ/RimL family protein N-acetyltransferase